MGRYEPGGGGGFDAKHRTGSSCDLRVLGGSVLCTEYFVVGGKPPVSGLTSLFFGGESGHLA